MMMRRRKGRKRRRAAGVAAGAAAPCRPTRHGRLRAARWAVLVLVAAAVVLPPARPLPRRNCWAPTRRARAALPRRRRQPPGPLWGRARWRRCTGRPSLPRRHPLQQRCPWFRTWTHRRHRHRPALSLPRPQRFPSVLRQNLTRQMRMLPLRPRRVPALLVATAAPAAATWSWPRSACDSSPSRTTRHPPRLGTTARRRHKLLFPRRSC